MNLTFQRNTPLAAPSEAGGRESAKERRCRFLAHLIAGEPTALEWVLATLKVVWGGWLLLPFSTFATAPHLYRFVAETPQWVWGSAFFALGSVHWTAWYHGWQKARFGCGVLAAIVWERFGWLAWRGDHHSSALVFLGVLSLAQMLAAVWLYGKAFPSASDRKRGYDRG